MIEDKILELVREVNPYDPVKFVKNIVKDYAIEKLNQYITECTDCSICTNSKTITYGKSDASILVITDSVLSEQKELKTAYPLFETKQLEMIKKTLEHFDLNLDEFFFINSINCLPCSVENQKTFSRPPTIREKSNCKVFIDYAISVIDPVFIIILGNIALNTYKKESILNQRGKLFEIKGIPAIATISPDYILWTEKYNQDDLNTVKTMFIKDFEKITKELSKYKDTNLFIKRS